MLGKNKSAPCNNKPWCQNYTDTPGHAIKIAMAAGVNIDDNGPDFEAFLVPALASGDASMALVNDSARRVLMAAASLGLLDPRDGPFDAIVETDTALARQLALEAAEQSQTLLQNDGTLPLHPSATVAVIGPMGNDLTKTAYSNGTTKLLSNYNGLNEIVMQNTPLHGLSRHFAKVEWDGWNGQDYCPGGVCPRQADRIKAAVKACAGADVAVLFLTDDACGEGRDRDQVELSRDQRAVSAAVFALGIPVVAVLLTSGPTAVPELKASANAIVQAYLPGQAAGEAIARVLSGQVSPAGKLPYTIYPGAIVNRSMFLTDLVADGGITYLHYTGKYGEALWPYGFGLSYSNISECWTETAFGERVDAAALARSGTTEALTASVTVKNTGSVTTDHTVLAFIKSSHDSAPVNKRLFGFDRTAALQPGESRTLSIPLLSEQLALPNKQGTLPATRHPFFRG
jgi:hypothetical protein